MADYPLLGALAQEATAEELLGLLDLIADRVGVLSAVRQQDNSLRVSIASGTVSIASGTVSIASGTVSTVTNQAQTGGYAAQQIVPAQQNLAAVLSNIANVEVS